MANARFGGRRSLIVGRAWARMWLLAAASFAHRRSSSDLLRPHTASGQSHLAQTPGAVLLRRELLSPGSVEALEPRRRAIGSPPHGCLPPSPRCAAPLEPRPRRCTDTAPLGLSPAHHPRSPTSTMTGQRTPVMSHHRLTHNRTRRLTLHRDTGFDRTAIDDASSRTSDTALEAIGVRRSDIVSSMPESRRNRPHGW